VQGICDVTRPKAAWGRAARGRCWPPGRIRLGIPVVTRSSRHEAKIRARRGEAATQPAVVDVLREAATAGGRPRCGGVGRSEDGGPQCRSCGPGSLLSRCRLPEPVGSGPAPRARRERGPRRARGLRERPHRRGLRRGADPRLGVPRRRRHGATAPRRHGATGATAPRCRGRRRGTVRLGGLTYHG